MNTLRDRLTTLPRSTLEFIVASLIGTGAIIVLIAEAGLVIYSSGIYIFGENVLIVGCIASVLLVLTRVPNSEANDAAQGIPFRTSAALGVGAFGGAALLLARQGGLDVYNATIGLLIALSLFIALNAPSTDETAEARGWGIRFRSSAVGITAVLALTCLLRLLASPSDLLTYVLAPLTVFILPGLALALKDEETPVYVHIALIPALSIASQLIVVAWLLWLRIPLTPLAMLIGCVGITGAGFIANWAVRRRIS